MPSVNMNKDDLQTLNEVFKVVDWAAAFGSPTDQEYTAKLRDDLAQIIDGLSGVLGA